MLFYYINKYQFCYPFLSFLGLLTGDTPRLIKRKGKDKNISNVQDIVNIFLEMPPSSFPSYVAKDLSRLPPLSMNCFDIASLVKDIESLKIHTSILQESYESVVKAQLLACQNTNEITPEDATAETVQPVSTDPVCASPTVSQMLDDTDPIAQHESDDDDLLLLASLQQTSSSSSTGQLKPAKNQPRFSSYADSVKTGRRKTNAKSSRSTKPPTTPTPTALIRGSCKGSKLRSANVSRRPASTPRKQVGVFVTRLARSTTAKERVEHVKQETGLNVTYEQLKTKFDTYKSFCLRLSPRNQHCLLNSRVWPSGVMVRGYFE